MTMTTQSNPHSTKTAPLLHLFNRNRASTVAFENDVLTVWAKSGRIAHTISVEQIEEVLLQKQAVVNQLTVRTKLERAIGVGGLERSTSEKLYRQLHDRVEELLNDEAPRKALAIGQEIPILKALHERHRTKNRELKTFLSRVNQRCRDSSGGRAR